MPETRRCMGSAITHWATKTPDNIAIDDADGMVSYAELDKRVTEYARALTGAGFAKGDRICWLGKNSGLYFTLFAAASRAGMVMAPIGWRLAAPEVAYVLKDTRAPLLICEPEFAETARKAAQEAPDTKTIICTQSGTDCRRWQILSPTPRPATCPKPTRRRACCNSIPPARPAIPRVRC